jgi:signal transduction histidine kinase
LGHGLDECQRLPTFGGKHAAFTDLMRDLQSIDSSLEALQDNVVIGDAAGAQQTLRGPVHDAIDRADTALTSSQALAMEYAEERALDISSRREHAGELALVLGGMCVAGSIISGALAVRSGRRQRRLVVERARLLAERANELDAFAGRIAHDLRGPLGTISLRIDTLRGGAPTKAALDAGFTKLAGDVTRMQTLIEDLLEFATAGAAPTAESSVELPRIVDDVVSEVRVAAERAGAELAIQAMPRVSVACTAGALTSVLSNLLHNATKHVVDGDERRQITVRAALSAQNVRIEVEDTGPGIPAGSEDSVFEPLRRLPGNRHPGLGLGLATVKRIVEAYGGRVGVTSVPGSCNFWVEMPATATKEQMLLSA